MKRIAFVSSRIALSVALLGGAAATVGACSDSGEPSVADFGFDPEDLDDEIVGTWIGTLVDDTGAEESFSVDLLRSGGTSTESIDEALSSRLQCGDISRTAGTSLGLACLDVYETRLSLAGTLESDVSFAKRVIVEASYSVLGLELPATDQTVIIELPRGDHLYGTRDDDDNFTGSWTLPGGGEFGSFTMSRPPAGDE